MLIDTDNMLFREVVQFMLLSVTYESTYFFSVLLF